MMNMVTLAPRPSLLSRPQGVALIIGGTVVLWALMRDSVTVLIILVITVLFIMGLKKPLWAMAALIVSQLTLTSFMVSFISLRLLLSLLTLLILWGAFIRREVDLGPGARRLRVPTLLLISVIFVSNLVNTGFDYALKDLRLLLVGVLFVIFIGAIVKNPKQLKTLCAITCIAITTSAVIGVMQHYNILGMSEATVRPGFLSGELRVPGIAEDELELAYVLSASLLVVLCIYLVKGVSSSRRRLLLISMVFMIAALYFTYARSALFALGLGLVSIVLYLKSRIKWEIILIFLFLVIIFFVQTDILGKTYFSGRSSRAQLESTVSRDILWQSAIAIVIKNPVLGIGGGQFISVSPQYADSVDPTLIQWEEDRYWNWRTLGTYEPHNDFLNVWASYGTIALIAFFWLHFAIIRNCMDSFRASKSRFIKGLSLGIAGALVTYMVNAFYHNISGSLPLLWILAGFSLVAVKFAVKKEANRQLSQVDTGNINK